MNTVRHFINKTFKRLRVFLQLDIKVTSLLRRKSKLEGWASVYVYPKNRIKVAKEASIHVVNGLLTFAKPWFEAKDNSLCEFEMEGDAKLECEGSFDFVRGSQCVIKSGASLRLGDGGRMGKGSNMECSKEIVIGKNCWISDNVTVADAGKIIIEDGVWIGNGVQIIGNVKIGKNAVIGEGMKVTENVEQSVVFNGDCQ